MQREILGAMLGAGLLLVAAEGCGSSGRDDSDFTDEGGDAGTNTSGGTSSSGGKSSSGGSIGGGSSGDGGHSSSSGGATCATATAVATREPVYLDIVLDGSGSMDAQIAVCKSDRNTYCAPNSYEGIGFLLDCFGEYGVCRDKQNSELDPQDGTRYTGKKWIAARESLKAYFDASAPAASTTLGVGLLLFSSSKPGQVPIAVLDTAQSAAMWGLIAPQTWPSAATPLRASIDGQATYLRAFTPTAPLAANGRHVILLITDGVPVGDATETKATVTAAVQAAIAGTPKVEVAVVGVGNPSASADEYDATFLSQLAQLGGLAPAGCKVDWKAGDAQMPCHLQVTPGEKTAAQIKDEMTAAINAIAGSIASCNLALDKSSPIDATKVNVVYTDSSGTETQLPQDASNGWTYDNPDDPSQVILHGTACDNLQSQNGAVNIVIGCPTGTTVVN